MALAKYKEDILEAISDSEYYRTVGNYEIRQTEPPLFVCLYCYKIFNSKEELYKHIRDRHNVPESIVSANGKIVHGTCYVKDLQSLIISRYVLENKIFLNGKIVNDDHKDNYEVDVTELARQQLMQERQVEIIIGNQNTIIKLISKEHIDVEKMNAIVAKCNNSVSLGRHISKDYSHLNDVERRCFDGIYNYFIACVSSGKDKDERYNDAYHILTEFVDIMPLAKFMLKIIAFRLNWMDHLATLCTENDVFKAIYKVLIKDKQADDLKTINYTQVFIEHELRDLIEIILAIKGEKESIIDEFFHSNPISKIRNIVDVNYRDKVCLLLARISNEKGNKHLARRFYGEIQSLCFETETKEFVKNL